MRRPTTLTLPRLDVGAALSNVAVRQALKAAAATGLAWWLTGRWLPGFEVAGALTAFLVVEATVARSVRSAIMLGLGTATGVLTGLLTHDWIDPRPISAGIAVLVALGAGAAMHLDQGGTIQAATLALTFLSLPGSSEGFLGHRLAAALLGGVLGVAVNAGMLMPAHTTSVRRHLANHACALADLAATLGRDTVSPSTLAQAENWLTRLRALDDEADRLLTLAKDAVEAPLVTSTTPMPGARARRESQEAARLTQAATALHHAGFQLRSVTRALVDHLELATDSTGAIPVYDPDNDHSTVGATVALPESFGRLFAALSVVLEHYAEALNARTTGELEVRLRDLRRELALARIIGGEAAGSANLAAADGNPGAVFDPKQHRGTDWVMRAALISELARSLNELDPVNGGHTTAFTH